MCLQDGGGWRQGWKQELENKTQENPHLKKTDDTEYQKVSLCLQDQFSHLQIIPAFGINHLNKIHFSLSA